jgi:sterol desaturase/sphingolipid hydroxylase (fatty acid hydroxylase superfamily)
MWREPTVLAIPFFLLSMALEAFVLLRGGHPYERRDTLTSLSGGLGNLVVKAVTAKALTLALYELMYAHRIVSLGTGLGVFVALIFAEDLCYYAYHRASHEVRLFWAGHVAHHSSQRYTLATALRQSWTEPVMGVCFWLPLPLLGFRPEQVMLASSISLLYQYWIHTETIRTLGPLEWVMNTPSHHRVHHGSNERYLDKNHGGIFILWDRLFGTFEPESEKVIYGLTKNVGTFNPVVVQFHEFADIARDVRAAKSWRARLRAVFASPAAVAAAKAQTPAQA